MDKGNVIKLLVLEDNVDDAFLIERTLKQDGFAFNFKRVDNRQEFADGLKDFKPDVILSDHALPEFNSIEAFKMCRSMGYNRAFILVTGAMSDEFAINCLKSGVDDYILKSNLSRLPSSIRSVLNKKRIEKEKEEHEIEIIRLNSELEFRIKERTQELWDAKHFSESIINRLPGIFYVLNRNLKIIEWNNNFEGLFGHPDKIGALNPLETVDEANRDQLTNLIERTFLTGESISEVTIITKHKERVPYDIRSFRTKVGDQVLIFLIGFDISEQKRAQEALRLSKERLEALVTELSKNAILLKESNDEAMRQKEIIQQEKKKSDALLASILPDAIAKELKEKGHVVARRIDQATILFADLVDFTILSKDLSPEELSNELNWIFVGFDFIADKYNVERIKTIGDGYMAAGGVTVQNETNAVDTVKCGLEMCQFIERLSRENQKSGKPAWRIRIGIHTGEVIAGVIGKSKFSFDIWGTAVNTASRLESASVSGQVNISGTTYKMVKEHFKCTPRGSIFVKNMGEMPMYFAERL